MSDKDFAGRWADRKRKVAEEEQPEELPIEEPVAEVIEDERSDEEILEEFGLKDPDSLEKGDDFSGFMNSALPTRIRNRALRKLWVSNPTLAAVDGLIEYGEDYTDAATVIENLQTAYQVGKGILKKIDGIESDEDTISLADKSENLRDEPVSAEQELSLENSEDPAGASQIDEVHAGVDGRVEVVQQEIEAEPEFIEFAKNNRRMHFRYDDEV